MSDYRVYQAYDGQAAQELCSQLDGIQLLILNTIGTGMDTPTLVRAIRRDVPRLPVLHIGNGATPGMPDDVPTLDESFTAAQLLATVQALIATRTAQ